MKDFDGDDDEDEEDERGPGVRRILGFRGSSQSVGEETRK